MKIRCKQCGSWHVVVSADHKGPCGACVVRQVQTQQRKAKQGAMTGGK